MEKMFVFNIISTQRVRQLLPSVHCVLVDQILDGFDVGDNTPPIAIGADDVPGVGEVAATGLRQSLLFGSAVAFLVCRAFSCALVEPTVRIGSSIPCRFLMKSDDW